jgi:hydroxymethylbilane synthase
MSQPGFFVREIETALTDEKIDLAIHSLKDLPSTLPEGLTLGAFLKREDPADVLCSVDVSGAEEIVAAIKNSAALSPVLLNQNSRKKYRIATSSPRRASLIHHYLPNCETLPIRGNVDTRLNKLVRDGLDGIILARAGLNRLGIDRPSFVTLPTDLMIPPAGQGIIAVERLNRRFDLQPYLTAINDLNTELAANAERAFMSRLQAGCQSAVGVHATVQETQIKIAAMVLSVDGKIRIQDTISGRTTDSLKLTKELVDRLISRGADKLL